MLFWKRSEDPWDMDPARERAKTEQKPVENPLDTLRDWNQERKARAAAKQAALEAQRPFFTGETAALTPMTLSALAEKLALHPSTVSRAVRGKYLQCRRGTYPLRYFFSRPVSGGISRQAAKQTLLALVKAEDPCHPLSDQALCGLLEGRGIYIARRTVAKYRLELGIRSSAARRK